MLAVGGLLVAVAVLSLVRLAPESGVGGLGTAEAEPRTDHRSGATAGPDRPDRAGNAAATVAARATAAPSATPPPAGVTPPAVPGAAAAPTSVTVVPRSSAAARPGAPAPHRTPSAPGPVPTTRPPAPPATTAPAPPPSSAPPAPAPTPRGPGLCVPLIGLCVDLLDAPLLPGAATPGRPAG
ncbi:hypothetical protein E4U92_03880 [Streptomyces galbus]|uniref:Uncharacterized protein n=1 Tax=Streptomyces galbus TaxID=33898 RepID=A0A4U5X9P2_STRGB|nr:hypothetical protein E4U92_03880 [Streptomyces galbus]